MMVECNCGWSGYDSELYENRCPKCDGNVMAAAPEDQAHLSRIEANIEMGIDPILHNDDIGCK